MYFRLGFLSATASVSVIYFCIAYHPKTQPLPTALLSPHTLCGSRIQACLAESVLQGSSWATTCPLGPGFHLKNNRGEDALPSSQSVGKIEFFVGYWMKGHSSPLAFWIETALHSVPRGPGSLLHWDQRAKERCFCSPTTGVTSHRCHYIWFIGSKSPGPAHTTGEDKQCGYREMEIFWSALRHIEFSKTKTHLNTSYDKEAQRCALVAKRSQSLRRGRYHRLGHELSMFSNAFISSCGKRNRDLKMCAFLPKFLSPCHIPLSFLKTRQ